MNTFNDIQLKQQIWAKQKGLTRETQFAGTEHETYLLANPHQNLSLKVLPAFYKELEAGKVDISLENTANVQNAKNTKSASRR